MIVITILGGCLFCVWGSSAAQGRVQNIYIHSHHLTSNGDLHNIIHQCIVLVWSTGQTQVDNINYAAPGNPADSVELGRCDDDIILTVRSFLIQINTDDGLQFGDPCDTTSTFAELCEATVRCRFTQTEYRDAVRDVCGATYDQAQMTFVYNCLPGTRPFTAALQTFARLMNIMFSYCILCRNVSEWLGSGRLRQTVLQSTFMFLASSPKSIVGLNTNLNRNTLHYLKSQNFDGIPDDSANDDSTTCVVTPADEQTFTASVFRANAFTDAAEFTTGQLEVYGVTAGRGRDTSRPLARAGLTASGLTRQSVNYTDLLRVSLKSLNFTYTKGEDNLIFLMQLQGTWL